MEFTRIVLAVVLAGGCATDELDLDDVSQDVVAPNGISLNGISLNGISLNGISLNGISLNGVSLSGVNLSGVGITALSGTKQPLTGTGVVGSKWTATLSNGLALPLRIDSAVADTGANSDVWMYAVSYQVGTTWTPLCGLDANKAPIRALTVPGTWNTQAGVVGGGAYIASTTQFTFACAAKTIAKCVDLGYKPWSGYSTQLQSCVRLLRSDICGDGTPHTVDGQTLNIYDNLGIQKDTEVWFPEGEWNANGATCITKLFETRFANLGLAVPSCALAKETVNCGIIFHSGSVLIDELPQSK